MKIWKILAGFIAVLAILPIVRTQPAAAAVQSTATLEIPTPGKPASPTADHRKFEALKEDFQCGPEVTAACLSCHTEAVRQVHQTIHWTWTCDEGEQKGLGKSQVINNF